MTDNLSKPDLFGLLKYWQSVLKLLDWDIRAEYVAPSSMNTEGATGECYIARQAMRAKIKVLDPQYQDDSYVPYDAEDILVHELLHIVFWRIWFKAGTKDDSWEQGLNKLAAALVSQRRQMDELRTRYDDLLSQKEPGVNPLPEVPFSGKKDPMQAYCPVYGLGNCRYPDKCIGSRCEATHRGERPSATVIVRPAELGGSWP